MATAKIELPPKLVPIFTGEARNRAAYGGRGSGKTRSFALMAGVRAYQMAAEGRDGVILCGREFMNSLEDSSLPEVKSAIERTEWLRPWFDIGEKYIRTTGLPGRIDFKFAGLRHSLDSIKSKSRVLIAWVDEAENVSEAAWRKLRPTVREQSSEIWVSWNPQDEGSPTDLRYRQNTPMRTKIVEVNYTDNPWFPDELEEERINDLNCLDPNTYAHIWEGAYLVNSDAQVLAGKWRVAEFEPEDHWSGPYHGLDFGFSQDPTAATRSWIDGDRLLIEYEAGGVGIEISDTTKVLKKGIPGIERYEVLADSSRPETISHLANNGLHRCKAAKKWSGSVEDGIAYLRGFREIVIHPRCRQVAKEARLWSYKVDTKSGQVLTDLVDGNDHYWDSIRYGHQPMIRKRETKASTTAVMGAY